MKPGKQLLIAAIITLPGLGGLGLLLMYLFHYEQFTILLTTENGLFFRQLGIGTAFAAISSAALLGVLQLSFFKPVNHFFAGVSGNYPFNFPVIIGLSLCAGIGEELLFRGAIQPWLGIWLTAFVFILLHGYLNPFNRPLAVYGMILLIVSAGFGYLTSQYGLYAAMTAHTLIDIALLWRLKQTSAQ